MVTQVSIEVVLNLYKILLFRHNHQSNFSTNHSRCGQFCNTALCIPYLDLEMNPEVYERSIFQNLCYFMFSVIIRTHNCDLNSVFCDIPHLVFLNRSSGKKNKITLQNYIVDTTAPQQYLVGQPQPTNLFTLPTTLNSSHQACPHNENMSVQFCQNLLLVLPEAEQIRSIPTQQAQP